jgi:hypothetical protein
LLNRKINIKYLLVSLKAPTNSKDCTKSSIRFFFRLSISITDQFSEQFSGSQAAIEGSQAALGKPEQVFDEGYWKDIHNQ